MHDTKQLTDFLIDLGIEKVAHTEKTYLGHLVAVERLMRRQGCTDELCRAGMFHSIYGTEKFQGFKIGLDQREMLAEMIGERAEKLAYINCVMDRATLDRSLDQNEGPYSVLERESRKEWLLDQTDFDDLCRVHLYDWLEQVARSSYGWGYRREAYRKMAERLGGVALSLYDATFAKEPAMVK